MRKELFTALVATLTLALAGCGGSGSSSGASAQPAKAPEAATAAPAKAETPAATKLEAISVKVGSTEKAALKNLPINLTGFGEAEGVKVEYQEYKGGSEVAKALLNGEVDMALMATDLVLKDKSGEFRMVAMVTNGPGQALIIDSQFKDSIKSVKDLAGQKVGVSSLGSGPHKTLNEMLAANKVDPKSVTVIPVGLNSTEVLGTGKVAAMITIEPYITLAESSGKGTVLVDLRNPAGIQTVYGANEVPWIALVTRTGFMEKNPAAVERMVAMVVKSLKFIATSSAGELSQKTPSFFKDEVKGDEALFTKMLEGNKATFSKDGGFNQAALDTMWKSLQASGAVSKETSLPYEQIVDAKFQQKVSSK
jgi:NitT/TauT family transport system substrate-binding protein